MKNLLKQQLENLLEEGSDEELEVLQLFLNGMTNNHHDDDRNYLTHVLQISEGEQNDEHFIMKMPNTPLVQNNLNILHGGITATLLDTAMGIYANSLIPDQFAAVTSEIKVNYIAPGVGDELTCVASTIHRGRKTIVMEGKVFRDDQKLVAHATGSFFIIPKRK